MRIIFVCTGNTCRSPMAESIAKAKMPEYIIESRGVLAQDGQLTSQNTLNIINEHHLPSPSNAKRFTAEDLNADLILTMSQSHKETIQQVYGETEKIFTINEYVQREGEITDPYGGSLYDYNKIYNELNLLIDTLKNKILK
ncbi:low molecular weight phosphatase family protein [Staphylococcus equorum]|uniref:low molecular weight protein arginine phosphatase n=1 Tax=Staphylococcus equorum TaxID=246432 RepID=UPI000D1C2868|nr:low molecular weight protein arginine phosphatase [Staphylococcus equorum]PTE42927.1 low molecular weight phosphatase family protein [Staphylococcus equorum]PTE84488.1 low molecular weight phosphatase family protein [Staphylococcus equorum]PTF11630.1 low molecular weight phosphatase family protein [Staphylococcus equorum]RIL47720.1 low molecular weight protein arginine phosphatase [Staphylococcus equorum]